MATTRRKFTGLRGRGGPGRGQGRKPGSGKLQQALKAIERLPIDETTEAGSILLAIDYRGEWLKLFKSRSPKARATKLRGLMYLMDKAQGKAFVQPAPTQKPSIQDAKLTPMLRDLLPPTTPQGAYRPPAIEKTKPPAAEMAPKVEPAPPPVRIDPQAEALKRLEARQKEGNQQRVM